MYLNKIRIYADQKVDKYTYRDFLGHSEGVA